MRVAFGGGGARACSVAAGALSVLDIEVISATSGSTWAVTRWLQGALMYTPADWEAPHCGKHVLYMASKENLLSSGVLDAMLLKNSSWTDTLRPFLLLPDGKDDDIDKKKIVFTVTSGKTGKNVSLRPRTLEEAVEYASWSSFPVPVLANDFIGGKFIRKEEEKGDWCLDGGLSDNTGVVSMLEMGCEDFVVFSFPESPYPNDIARLFGPVFRAEDLERTLEGLRGSAISRQTYQVVHGGEGEEGEGEGEREEKCVAVTWVVLSSDEEFYDSLPPALAAAIRADIPHFPFLKTLPSASQKQSIITLSPFAANALFYYGKWLAKKLMQLSQGGLGE